MIKKLKVFLLEELFNRPVLAFCVPLTLYEIYFLNLFYNKPETVKELIQMVALNYLINLILGLTISFSIKIFYDRANIDKNK
jgi:hypothetical protein